MKLLWHKENTKTRDFSFDTIALYYISCARILHADDTFWSRSRRFYWTVPPIPLWFLPHILKYIYFTNRFYVNQPHTFHTIPLDRNKKEIRLLFSHFFNLSISRAFELSVGLPHCEWQHIRKWFDCIFLCINFNT